jgi:hypothetical protein
VGQVELLSKSRDGCRVPTCEDWPVAALLCVLGDQGAGITRSAIENPGLCVAHGISRISLSMVTSFFMANSFWSGLSDRWL